MQDPRLKNSSRGLLAVMLSMPADWDFYQRDLIKRCGEGEDAIRSQMKDLVKFGYLIKRPQSRSHSGKWGNISYEVWDTSQICGQLTNEQVDKIFSCAYNLDDFQIIYPKPDFPVPVSPGPENPGLQHNKEQLPSVKEDNNTEQDCSCSLLKELDIPIHEKRKIAAAFLEPAQELLVKRVLRWKGRRSDLIACRTIMNKWNEWSDSLSEEEKKSQYEDDMVAIGEKIQENKEYAEEAKIDNPCAGFEIYSDRVMFKTKKGFFPLGFAEEDFIDRFEKMLSIQVL